MKKSLLALALFAFAGSAAFAQDVQTKDTKKATASVSASPSCSKDMKGGMAGSSCCMKKDGKTASVKPAAKPVAAVKL